MDMRLRKIRGAQWLLLCALCAPAAGPVFAVTVHTWVDSDGVRHYADEAPAQTATEQFDIDARDPDAAEDDYYSINNQWARVRAEREADAALRLEQQRLRAEQAAARQAQENTRNPRDERYYARGFNGYFPFGGGYGFGHPQRYGNGRGADIDRGTYLDQRRRRGFTPGATPQWPRQR